MPAGRTTTDAGVAAPYGDDAGAPAGSDGPQAPGRRPPGLGPRGWLRWMWRQLTSMRTALVLLFLLAVAAVPGSLLPQRDRNPEQVAEYFERYPNVAPVLDRLSMFDVFAAPWFAAIYLLLFTSLAGCVVPRTWRHARALRSRPPDAPRNLSRLPYSARWETDLAPDDAVRAARDELSGRRFRLRTGDASVAAEKGYARETGNLVFHLALLALLFAVAAGALFGYRGNILLVEGDGFANTVASYDEFDPGRVSAPQDLQPFTLRLEEFDSSFVTSGPQRGQPRTFSARIRYQEGPSTAERTRTVEVNHPLAIGGAKVYLLGHGYAPTFEVRDGEGRVAFSGAVPFLPADQATFTSEGVVKVPDASPEQLAFSGFFTPTTARTAGGITSTFPAPNDPAVTLLAYAGDLGLDSGVPQSVYQLDTNRLDRLEAQVLRPGDTMELPDDLGALTFTGYKQYATFQVTYDPARWIALITAVLAVVGLIATLAVRRRRIWVRARDGGADAGRTLIEVGGLPRADPGGGFADEFATLTDRLRPVTRAKE